MKGQMKTSYVSVEIQKMELNPMAYLQNQNDVSNLNAEEQLAKKQVLCWAHLLIFDPEKVLQLSQAAILEIDKKANIEMFIAFHLIKISALSMMMRLPEMKSCLDAIQSTALQSKVLYFNMALNLSYATYYYRVQETARAESLTMKMVNLVETIKDHYQKADILWRLAAIYNHLRKYDVSLLYYVDCFGMCLKHSFRLRALQVSVELVSLNANLGNFVQAEKFYKLALELESDLAIPIYRIGLNFNYGLAHKLQNKLSEAITYYETSLKLMHAEKLNMPQTTFNIYNNLANALSENGRSEEAIIYHEKAMKLAIEMNNLALQMQSSTNIALALIALKRYDEVLPLLEKPIAFYKKTKNWELLSKALRSKGFLYQETKDYKKGFATLSKLDAVQLKLVAQIRADCAAYDSKLLDTHLEDTRSLKTKYELAKQTVAIVKPHTYIGSSDASKKVVESALLAAMYPDAGVFIEGESGTGKEVVARLIHTSSNRSDKPYVTVNCASISPSLFESEFFGHIRGSFTGANQDKQGFFQLANHGTLFLDEISEMPLEFQAKLLRAIDTKKIIPVGKGTEQKIDCKIIAATNHNIAKLIVENKFRLDLYHRINTIEIHIPALRDRIDDIPDLLEFFTNRYSAETNKRKPTVNADFIERLSKHTFPGNVRELKNYVERLFILHYRSVWDASILDNISTFSKSQQPAQVYDGKDIKSIEAEIIIQALKQAKGKQKTAALILNMTESTLSRKIKRLGIVF